jgi:exonuclease VII small subunit
MGTSMDERPGADLRPVEEMSYTEASSELDAIVGFFEGRDVDVDQLVGRLVRATAIIEELDKRLRRTRMQVEQLVPRLAAVLDDVPDDEDGGRSEGDSAVDGAAGGSFEAAPESFEPESFEPESFEPESFEPVEPFDDGSDDGTPGLF